MYVKFRIASAQIQKMFESDELPILSYCGKGDYNDGKDQYVVFTVMGLEFFPATHVSPKKTNYLPVLFINEGLQNNVLPQSMDDFFLSASGLNCFGVIGIIVLFRDGSIHSVIAHYKDGSEKPVDSWAVIGSDISIHTSRDEHRVDETQQRTLQTFGEGTTKLLRSMRIGVVGVSGTGSPMIEMLYRTGVGNLLLIDPDKIELKNINRILNSGTKDAKKKLYKVDVIKHAIKGYGFTTSIEALAINLFSRHAVKALSVCDVIFGCTDTADSRALLNNLSEFYCVPYIDVGVQLDADGQGGIRSICAAINYISPAGQTLRNRGTITDKEIMGATLYRTSPNMYEQQEREHYIVGAKVDSPAVLCVNMAASSFAFLDFMSRIHEIRSEDNSRFERTYIDYTNMRLLFDQEEPSFQAFRNIGRGDVEPLLNNTELSTSENEVING